MTALNNKIDFALVYTVRHANPNGDPLDGNRPRTTFDGIGETSDVCLKRKIRNRLLDEGYSIFVQQDDRRAPGDNFRSLRDRADGCEALKSVGSNREEYAKIACEQWYDVRAFGQVFAFKSKKAASKKKGDDSAEDGDSADAVSIGIRGPVSIHPAFSLDRVNITSTQITKSVNLETGSDPDKKAPDTMGMKHRVDYGVYVTYGSINTQLAAKTGFSAEDAEALKEALRTLFRNDATSARPDGSMEVVRVAWWTHDCANGQYSAAKVHRSLVVEDNGGDVSVSVNEELIKGLSYELIDGE